jgi:transcriptional regulator GlxA family with amidase domain
MIKFVFLFCCISFSTQCHAQVGTVPTAIPKEVAILLYDGIELLDFAGPGEVFQQAEWNSEKAFHVYTVAVGQKEIISQDFLHVTADYNLDDAPLPDLLVIPGGNSMSQVNNEKLIAWIDRVNAQADYMMSVCNGVRLLAKTGALDGLKATSHYGAIDNLTKEFPKVTMVRGKRFVDNGRIITTEGVSAGIDGSLYLLTKIFNAETAQAVAQQMMYKWEPEKLDVIVPGEK